ncbi:GNAT family N-acetyltransferase [Streptomyces sp. TRM70308]|uniref:GNAT family N-acetyltransferase n=1 Tax=Streptomyces sp. TRM70308 TaxID=3131932 RepID=UPI003D0402F9
MTAATTVRRARPEDAAALGALQARAWRAAYTGMLPPALLAGLHPRREAARWADHLARQPDGHRLWVVEERPSTAVLGYCRTGPADFGQDADLGADTAEVHGLYVDPARLGTGLGRRLFAHAVADLTARGHRPVCVYAYRPNTRALRFHRRAGFTADGTTRLDEADGTGVRKVRLVRYGTGPTAPAPPPGG